jgi:hypothetical protein
LAIKAIEAQAIDDTPLRLLQPIELPRLAKAWFFVSPSEDEGCGAWLHASADGLNRAYGDDEPGYLARLIKGHKPDCAP